MGTSAHAAFEGGGDSPRYSEPGAGVDTNVHATTPLA